MSTVVQQGLAFIRYSADGSTKNYPIPFDYLFQTDIKATVNGEEVTFTWLNEAEIQLDDLPSINDIILVRRETAQDERLVNFQDGGQLREKTLDLDSDQLFNLTQEALDWRVLTPTFDPALDGVNAQGDRIVNLGPGIDPTDAVNKQQLMDMATHVDNAAEIAVAAASAADNSADAAAASAAAALISANNADNSEAVVLAAETFLQSGTGAVSRTWQNKQRDIVSVRDFGAVGDGIADDTDAIQAALTYAATSVQSIITNKVDMVTQAVYIPAGVYKTSAVLVVGEGVTLFGASRSTSIIKPTHSGVAIQLGGAAREYSNINIRDLGIIGNRSGTLSYGDWTTTTTIGIYAENCIRGCAIEDCFITQCTTSIKTENSYAFKIMNNYLVYAIDYHITSDNLVNGVISGNRIDWSEKHGVYLNGTNSGDETIGLMITNNAIQICWRNALWLHDCSSASVINNFFESNYREAVDDTTHVYADINIESGPNTRGYSFNVNGNFFTHGSSPTVDAYTCIRADRAVSLNCIGNVCRDSSYWRFVDAGANVARLIVLGNSFSGTFTKVAYTATTTFGIIEEQSAVGNITIPNLKAGSMAFAPTVTSSNVTSNEFRSAYLINCASGNRTVSLRDVDCVAGRVYILKKTDGGTDNQLIVTREAGSTKTVDGASSVTSTAAYATFRIISDGTNWFTF